MSVCIVHMYCVQCLCALYTCIVYNVCVHCIHVLCTMSVYNYVYKYTGALPGLACPIPPPCLSPPACLDGGPVVTILVAMLPELLLCTDEAHGQGCTARENGF